LMARGARVATGAAIVADAVLTVLPRAPAGLLPGDTCRHSVRSARS
jgi:hypothetical protein